MLTIECSAGRLAGRGGPEGVSFLGIPYAAALRWAPPRAYPRWTGVREATQAGPGAPQPRRPVAEFTHGPRPATDEQRCLNLNVFTPATDGSRPVLVFIHGGGFAIGHGAASLYDGARLARDADAVVVTLNYRLGSLGWLADPRLCAGAGTPAANWGLLDQIAALQWVAENIGAFGGDPGRVTLSGQSAGALSAMDLLVVPDARGLFSRAILQSPPLGDLAQPPEQGERWAQALADAAGGWPALRSLEAERVVALHETLLDDPAFRGTRGGALPTLDAPSIPSSPLQTPQASPDVDVLIGHAAQEGTFFFDCPWRPSPPDERIPAIVAHLCHTDAPDELIAERREARGGGTLLETLVDIATDAMVAQPLADWAGARAAALAPTGRVFRYRVDHPGAGPQLRATHTVEVPLVFSTFRDGGPGERLGGQAPGAEAVGAALRAAWARFVHDGDPGWGALGGAEDTAVFGASK